MDQWMDRSINGWVDRSMSEWACVTRGTFDKKIIKILLTDYVIPHSYSELLLLLKHFFSKDIAVKMNLLS